MKKIVFLLGLLLFAVCIPAFGQDAGDEVSAGSLSTFVGCVAIVSFIVTQGAKFIPFIGKNTLTKIACSVAVGIVLAAAGKLLNIAAFLIDMEWLQVILQGAFAGLSACGFYDVLKSLGLVGKDG